MPMNLNNYNGGDLKTRYTLRLRIIIIKIVDKIISIILVVHFSKGSTNNKEYFSNCSGLSNILGEDFNVEFISFINCILLSFLLIFLLNFSYAKEYNVYILWDFSSFVLEKYSTEESINIPYRYLVPLNISFNWSLQNLSSYYTDIGFFWIIVYLFILIALPYAIIKKDKVLVSVSLTTII